MNGNLTGPSNLGQSWTESNGNKGVLHITQISWTKVLLSNLVKFHILDSRRGRGVIHGYREYSTAPTDWVVMLFLW